MCDLDHFYDKETYPILAVSFYNLVPVCHACNHAKASNAISYSPHNTKFNTDDLLSFDFYIGGIDYWVDNKQIGIEIDCSRELESNVQELKLREVYQIHSDIVQECIKKAIMFNPDSLSIAMGILITFGSYMKKDTSIEDSTQNVEIFDTAIAIMAGLMIIPAVFAFSGGDPDTLQAGPALMFITIPKVFASMGLGAAVGILFFVLVLFAAVTSSIALTESAVSTFEDELHWSRKKATVFMAVIMLLLGTLSCLGYGPLAGVTF